jgi:hypothetical protein
VFIAPVAAHAEGQKTAATGTKPDFPYLGCALEKERL